MSPSPELVWEGKYDKSGKKVAPVRVALPFQNVETVNESSSERQRSLDLFSSGRNPQWRNRLVWGDKKYVLPALLPEFQGKVDLIYIDPPFATGDDFSFTAVVPHAPGKSGGAAVSFDKEPSLIEQKAYRDTWGRGLDGYIHWFSQTATVLSELLAPTGSLYVHCDYRVDSYVRAVLDEVLGPGNLRNVIRWVRSLPHNDPKQYGRSSDTILYYTRSDKWTFHPPFTPQKEESVEAHYKLDEHGRQYRLASLLAPGGRGPSYSYKGFVRNLRFTEDKMLELEREGRVFFREGQMPSRIYYLDESLGAQVQDVWTDVSPLNPMATERTGYPTQKPEALLERILLTSSDEGDLVLDCFAGSGTTAAVAERLGRRWIGSDLGRFAIHTTRKRLLSTASVKPFVIQNLGKYERQHWQAAEFQGDEDARQQRYRDFILKMYGATSLQGYSWLHGTRAGRMVHVGAVDAPVSPGDVTQMATELRRVSGEQARAKAIDVLGWDFAFELNEVAKQQSSAANINLRFFKIPLDVMDSRAVEQGDVKFFELAALAVKSTMKGREAHIALSDFVIPADDVPADVQSAIKDWSQWVDYWAIDWDNRTDTFHNEWQTYRTKDEPKLERMASHTYDSAGRYRVVVKVIDILGNDTTKILQLEVK